MNLPEDTIHTEYDWQLAGQSQLLHHGKQAASVYRVQRRRRGQRLFGAEIYICKEYPLAGVNWSRANGPRYVFGERNTLKALKGLKHPNIINYIDFFYEHNLQIAKLYTEYCRFGDLEQVLQNRKDNSKLETHESIHVLYQIACSLLYLHHGVYHTDNTLRIVPLPDAARDGESRNSWLKILHRDIKPANVFVAELTNSHIRVKLGDFGIAKTETDDTATYIGSPGYHAPEQMLGFRGPGRRRTTFKSDIYALGVTMETVMCASNGIRGDSAELAATLDQIIYDCKNGDDSARPSSGAIIDRCKPHIAAGLALSLASEVLTKVTASARGLTTRQRARFREELPSYTVLYQRCLESGSMPSQEAVLSFDSYAERLALLKRSYKANQRKVDARSRMIEQIWPLLRLYSQRLLRDTGERVSHAADHFETSPGNAAEIAIADMGESTMAVAATKERSSSHLDASFEDTVSQETAAAVPRHDLKHTDRVIAEIEASCKEEQEQERRYRERRIWERMVKEEEARLTMHQRDEELRCQEREAEAREDALARDRDDDDAEAKSMFASLGKNSPTILVSEVQAEVEKTREWRYQWEKNLQEAMEQRRKAYKSVANDRELMRQEREAEAHEEACACERDRRGEDLEAKAMFASLNQSFPGSLKDALATRERELMSRPHHYESLHKQPAPGRVALILSRFLGVAEQIRYPGAIEGPSSVLTSHRKGYVYDTPFLMQFRNVFYEKPVGIWYERMKEIPEIGKTRTSA